jgi:hypothetical protein
MTTSSPRRRPTKLSPETKWEIFLGVTAGDITQADAARKHAGVCQEFCVSAVI